MANKQESSIYGKTFAGVKITRKTLREPETGKFGIYEVQVGKVKSATLFGARKAFQAVLAIAKTEYPKAYTAIVAQLNTNKPEPKPKKEKGKLTVKETTTLGRLLKKAGVKLVSR